ncbi:MAG: hypothetical protein Q4C89_12070 [Deinococcus sp.]|uniref:hypothetical protein n=1 Tax=Deinococcus sp. TaxID=47478 RepID=UPI0026DB34D8|nr:hypothetical protein [Deinococcus sp.]MDO4246751.1 hypothetical protein [Deinococcus sp.]
MELPALFLCAALLYVAWLRLGWQRMTPAEVPALRRTAVLAGAVCLFLALYTRLEMESWSHLSFPFSLLAWGVLLLMALAAGFTQLALGRRGTGWPVLGVGVCGFIAIAFALLVNRFTSGDPIF